MMNKLPLLGVEAIGQGGIDGGISGVYAYPGTPSTEITEYIQQSEIAEKRNIRRQWSANEKTAMEAAIGMSYAGKRALVCMKHVGLNVAADPFINSAITGINGGIVLTVADDPSMHSSQNEQDSRFYGNFAQIPVLEPSNQQEAYNMVREGFELSERTGLPVMVRITTRLAHSRAGVVVEGMKPQNSLKLPADLKQFILLPAIARKRYDHLLDQQPSLVQLSEQSQYNEYIDGPNKILGIVVCGIAFNYLMENFPSGNCDYPLVKISQYPLPKNKLERLSESTDRLLVIEEGYPFVEEKLRDYFESCREVYGKLTGALPRSGELTPDIIAKALGKKVKEPREVPSVVASRPPALCAGCGHADVYHALNEAIENYGKGRVFSDIGCYTLGALAPFNSINSCLDMGASITMAKGAADAGLTPSIAVIGDSTFTHSGITGLLDIVNDNSPVKIIILDNDAVAMTGGQDSSASGKIEQICEGIGVEPEHIRVCTPLKKNHDEMVQIMKEEFEYKGVSVIIPRRECIQVATKRKKAEKAKISKSN